MGDRFPFSSGRPIGLISILSQDFRRTNRSGTLSRMLARNLICPLQQVILPGGSLITDVSAVADRVPQVCHQGKTSKTIFTDLAGALYKVRHPLLEVRDITNKPPLTQDISV
ncbi:hypothetical protein FGIG_05403 [Fasciola gigantica]|uniref:Uncharacterized protein n=1 Tax=Fasciola gigantica TaxID=46835 RepID=A0A504YFN4_FASGI|nr:hypothetical protein FGIG_05403 [Fasciola gigantica]